MLHSLTSLFKLAGLGTLGLGLWLRFDGAVSELIALHGGTNNFNIACYLLIAAGAIMSLIGFLEKIPPLDLLRAEQTLFQFFIILVLVFCLELTCAIVAYSHQDLIRRYIDNSMYETIHQHYAVNPEYAAIFDRIQTEFECCGVKSYRDWLHSSWGRDLVGRTELGIGSSSIGKVPKSCCNEDGLRDYPTNCGVSFDKLELWTYEPFLHTKGCSDALYESAYKNLDIAIAVSVIVGALQV
ncbi:unnamed protein product [Toxocara canis]|uniref:Tetraspanin n=1 Tax=Toxocara canis TaxID=6265 RepID=A0A183UNX8_TOXCA|nr:unnamed protein product [Toxocara canis]